MRLNLSILILALTATLSASAFNVGGINYEITDGNKVKVTKGTYSGDIVIPSTVEDNGVTYTVTEIANKAFENCTGLTTVTIPESLTKIGRRVFYGCSNLETVNYNAVNCSYYDATQPAYWLFEGCEKLTTVNIGDNVETISQNLFLNVSSLTTLTIGESVKTIEKYAFDGCTALETIYYNATNCERIGSEDGTRDVFAYVNNEERIDEQGEKYSVKVPYTSVKNVIVGENVESIPARAFNACTALETLDLSKAAALETIGANSFENCTALKAVDLSKTAVTTVNDHAFSGCRGMETLDLGNVEKVGAFAFDWCRTLRALELPKSLTEIGTWGFGNLLGLNTTTIYANPSSITIGDSAFYNNQSILINYSSEEMYPHSIEGCGGLMDSMDVVVNMKPNDGLIENGKTSDAFATVYIKKTSVEGGIDPTIEFMTTDVEKARVDNTVDGETLESKSITIYTVKVKGVAQTTGPETITMTLVDTNAEINATAVIPFEVQVYGEGGGEDVPTGIDSLFVDEEGRTVEVYTLQGVKVSNQDLAPGIYVRRVGDKAQKVLVK